MRSVDNRFYKSKAWEACRQSYLASHSLCERCLAQGHIVPARIVHHKQHLTPETVTDPSVALNHKNLEALCQDCHNKEHFGEKVEQRWKFTSEGELVARE